MNEAALYKRSNGLQRRDAQQVISEFSHLFRWREDGTDSIMDVGCGSGDVTFDFLLPIMPEHCTRIIGTDISDEMVKFANKKYANNKIGFEQLDISGDISKYINLNEQFDHIVSFYCFHWIQNQKNAVKNVHQLLLAGGDCLLVFLAKIPIFDIYKQMSKNKRWSKYMNDVDRFVSPYQHSKDPADEFGSLLYECGFTEFSVEMREKFFIYEGVELLKKSVKAVNPFLERMDASEHNDFLNDYIDEVRKRNLCINPNENDPNKCQFVTEYKLIVAYARK